MHGDYFFFFFLISPCSTIFYNGTRRVLEYLTLSLFLENGGWQRPQPGKDFMRKRIFNTTEIVKYGRIQTDEKKIYTTR